MPSVSVLASGERTPVSEYLIELCSCFGKIAFDSYEVARKAVQRGKKGRNSVRRDVYHCHSCGKYHAGSRSPETKAKKRLKNRILQDDLT
jgi:hypothetical protein